MSTMLPFTSTDLLFAAVAVGALLMLATAVFLLARLQQPALRAVSVLAVEPDAGLASVPSQAAATAGTVQHA